MKMDRQRHMLEKHNEIGVEYARETQLMKMDWKLEYARGQSESLERKAEVCVT